MSEPIPVTHTFYDVPVTSNGHFICNYILNKNNIYITSSPVIKCRTNFKVVSVQPPDDAPTGLTITTSAGTSSGSYTTAFRVSLPITEESRKNLRFYRGIVTCDVQTMGTRDSSVIIEPVTLQFKFPITISFEQYPLKPVSNGWPGDNYRQFGLSYTVRNKTEKLLKTYMIADKEAVMRDRNGSMDDTVPWPKEDIKKDIINPEYWDLSSTSYGITATSGMSGLAGYYQTSSPTVKFEAPGLIFNLEHTYMPGTIIVIDTNNQIKHKTCYIFQTYDSVAYNKSPYTALDIESIYSGTEFTQDGSKPDYKYRYWSVARQESTWYLKRANVDIAIPNDCSAEPVDRVSPPNLGWPCGIIFSDSADRLVSITNPFDSTGKSTYAYDYAEKGKYEGLPFFEINLKAPNAGQPSNPDYIVGADGLMPIQKKTYRYLHAHIVGDKIEWVLTNNFIVTIDTPRVNIQDTTSVGVPYGWPANSTYGQYIVNDIVLTATAPNSSSTDIFSVNHTIVNPKLALIATDIGDSFITETESSSTPMGLCGGVWSYYPACRTLPVFKGISDPSYKSNSTVTYTRKMVVSPDCGFTLTGYRHRNDNVRNPDPPPKGELDKRYYLLTAGDSPNSDGSSTQGGGVKATGLMMHIPAYEMKRPPGAPPDMPPREISLDEFAPFYLDGVFLEGLHSIHDEDLFIGDRFISGEVGSVRWDINDPETLVKAIGLQPALIKGFTGTYSDTITVPFTGTINNAINNASNIIQNAAVITPNAPTRTLVLENLTCKFTSDIKDDNDLYRKITRNENHPEQPKVRNEEYKFTFQSCVPIVKRSDAVLENNTGYKNSPTQSDFPLDITTKRPSYASAGTFEDYNYALNQSAIYYTLASGYVLSNTKGGKTLTGLEQGPYGRFSIAETSLKGLYNTKIQGSYTKPIADFSTTPPTFGERTGTFNCSALDYIDIKAYAPTPNKVIVDASDNVTISPAASTVVHTYKQCVRRIFKQMDYKYSSKAAGSTSSWGGETGTGRWSDYGSRHNTKYLDYEIVITHIRIAESLNANYPNNLLRAETIVTLRKRKQFGVITQAGGSGSFRIEAVFDPDGSKYEAFKNIYNADFQKDEFNEIIERKVTEHGVYPEFNVNAWTPNTTMDILIIEANKQVGNLFYEFTDTMTTELK